MGIRLLYGRAGSGKTSACLKEIRDLMRRDPLGPPLILLTPEQATFEAERELARGGGFCRAHVYGFRRLAHSVLMETGGAARPQLSDLSKRMILRQALADNEDQLTVFRQAAHQRTFAQTMASLISEFKAYSVNPRALAEAAVQASNSPLGSKLSDLAAVYASYEGLIAGRYADPQDYLGMLLHKISRSSLRGSTVFVDGFDWFTKQEYGVLGALANVAENLTITLCLDRHEAEDKQEVDLFYRQAVTAALIKQLAKDNQLSFEAQEVRSPGRFAASSLLTYIEQSLAGVKGEAPSKQIAQTEDIVIVEAANRRAEIEGIARDIIRLCRDKSYRWRDTAVLVRDEAIYSDIIATVFADYGIPCFQDRRRPAVHHPLAEVLRSSVEAIVERWDYEPVFRALKTGLFPLSDEQIDLLENYVLEFGIRGKRWLQEEDWRFMRRWSLDEDEQPDAAGQQYLDTVNTIRRQAIAPLAALAAECRRSKTAAEYTGKLFGFLIAINAPQTLEAWAKEAEAAGDLALAEEHSQLWNAIIGLFDELVDCCGDQAMTLEEYGEILGEGLEGLTLGLIPSGLDHVTVTSLDRTRLLRAKAVYLPGVNEGVLPRRGKVDSLFSDEERLLLKGMGVELAPGAAAEAFAETYLVYFALTRASEYLWVSYSLADEEGKGMQLSQAVNELKLRVQGGSNPGFSVRSLRLEPLPGEEKSFIAHPRRAASALAVSLRQSGGKPEDLSPVWLDVYNVCLENEERKAGLRLALSGLFHSNSETQLDPQLARQLWLSRGSRLRGSVTAFESFYSCPFQHFARFGLKLRERQVFKLEPPGMGLLLHAVVKSFGEAVNQSGRNWGDLSRDETASLCESIVGELAPKLQNEILLSNAQYRHIQGRIRRTAETVIWRLVEFDRGSSFKPIALEQSFGLGGDSLPPILLQLEDGIELELAGQIDRLDCAEHNGKKYFLVIDYKSGGAWLELLDVYHGLKLQLLLYLLASCRLGELLTGAPDCLPAGVLYYFLKRPSVTGSTFLPPDKVAEKLNAQMKMPGWVLADPDIVKLLDANIRQYSQFLKIGFNPDKGTFYKQTAHYLKDQEQFTLLMHHVEQQCQRAAKGILSGDIDLRPYDLAGRTACERCRFRPVCQFDRMLADNDFAKLPLLDDDTIFSLIGKEG
ncbi:hypothetical protein AXX12_17430 [Anaerosporomusa subterranea]|uniref:UvrD-like helicase C-terminal domain-containing protein n=1 Tax=Anaerosporomusa subterranea TaxID=1794912 RepID=A0A154BV82_ANASB|nr:helicase-exonuclease AddAB subunit AddB [Anaerosporomusa subterranea]KYZ77842.1 hypothetical protein AXX12_17430 [Anaerosporomusa subterranea]